MAGEPGHLQVSVLGPREVRIDPTQVDPVWIDLLGGGRGMPVFGPEFRIRLDPPRIESTTGVTLLDRARQSDAKVREASAGSRSDTAGPALKVLTSGAPAGSRCLFCRGFLDVGGCFGLLDELNQAVMKGRWDAARLVAETYMRRLETMNFSLGDRSRVH